jgi:hypothetical protein
VAGFYPTGAEAWLDVAEVLLQEGLVDAESERRR